MNNYHIYESIGKGMHSVVYKGRKKQHIEYYAIKSVQKSQKQRVHREVKTIHDLNHPNILRFHNWYETGNHLWLILEYCVGGDLKSLLHQDMRLPESSVHDFGRDLVAALQHLHSKGIIHCDLKPSNILLDENGSIKLGGFSVARKLADINKTPLSDLQPARRGTPAYMAPELFQEGATHSTASDLWAFGCVLYECYIGRPPFMNPSFNELVRSILHTEHTAITGASGAFANLISRLLDKNPATRMTWVEMLSHPFWQFTMSPLTMPQEPALERYIAKHNLRPQLIENVAMSQAADKQAETAAKILRESVDITKLSQIVRGNLEKDENDHTAFNMGAHAQAEDVNLTDADAEVDFDPDRDASGDISEADSAASTGTRMGSAPSTPSAAQPDASSQRPATTDAGPGALSDSGRAASLPQPGSADTDKGPTVSARPATVPASMALPGDDSPAVPIEKLVFHDSDLTVRPLVGNKKIERVVDAQWEANALPHGLTAWSSQSLTRTLQDAAGTRAQAFLDFVAKVNGTLLGPSSWSVKSNLLAYLESLCTDAICANALINTALTSALVQLFGHAKTSQLRVRIASVLGLLIRYATFIDDAIITPEVVDALRDGLNDSSDKVRRRVMATLGELLFYLSTTVKGSAQADSGPWASASATVTAIVRLLRSSEDEVTQHYAAKAIENIMTQVGLWPEKFATDDTSMALLQVLKSSKAEAVQATVCSALGRLLRFHPGLIPALVNQGGLQIVRQVLPKAGAKVQAHCLNIFNWILLRTEVRSKVKNTLITDRNIMASTVALLDSSSAYVRAKGLLCTVLLCTLHSWWLYDAIHLRLLPRFSRLQSEKDDSSDGQKYCRKCMAAMRDGVVALMPSILHEVSASLQGQISASASARQRPATALFDIVLHLVTQPAFRARVVTAALIAELAVYVRQVWGSAKAVAAHTELAQNVQHVLEALVQPPDLLVVYCDAVCNELLVALAEVTRAHLVSPTDSEKLKEIRVNSARMLTDVLMFFINHPDLYKAPGAVTRSAVATAGRDITADLDRLLTTHVVPMMPSLMAERDPLPLYAQKILATLLPRNVEYVEHVKQHNLVMRFFQYLSIESPNNNIHNMRVCRMIIATNAISTQNLSGMGLAEKVAAVLEYAHAHQVEPFLEPTVELCLALLQRDAEDIPTNAPGAGASKALVHNCISFIIFCGAGDSSLAFVSADCALLLSQLFPRECSEALLSDDGIEAMLASLTGEAGMMQAVQLPPPEVAAKLLMVLMHCGANGRSSASAETIGRLHEVVMYLQDSEAPNVADLAQQVAQMFA